jgi:endo-1,4-beta-xylanase
VTETKPLSRRAFLKLAGSTALGSAVAACGLAPTVAPPNVPTESPRPTSTFAPTSTAAMTPSVTATPSITPTATNTSTPTATPTPSQTPGPPTLRQLADQLGLDFGTAVPEPFWLDNPPVNYYDIISDCFNLAVVHIGLYWSGYEPENGIESVGSKEYVRRQIRKLRELGIRTIRAHPLIYPTYVPDWLIREFRQGNLTEEGLAVYMRRHIESVVSLITPLTQDVNREWIVVNEPYRGPGGVPPDIFLEVMGERYIVLAFEWMRELDPSSTLILNDTFNHVSQGYNSIWSYPEGGNTAQTKKLAAKLKDLGLVDRIGVEMHLDGANPPDRNDLTATLRSYDLPVSVTEFDVDIRNVPGTQEERLVEQADIYANVLDACMQSGVCTSFNIWEFGDKYSWLENPQYRGSPDADPTLFDDDLKPKPAYFALYDLLSRYAVASSSTLTATPSAP